jgi:hypothetical protein
MRPVRRGPSPQTTDYQNYRDAFPDLVSRIGDYCSFCERRIPTNLAVEHIQPKDGPHGMPDLIGRWDNFLLGCVNCNSTKGTKHVVLAGILLPDRENTFVAFDYSEDGSVAPVAGLPSGLRKIAQASLALTGLDKRPSPTMDANERQVALDRVSQRMEAWLQARDSRQDLEAAPNNLALRRQIARTARFCGYFSIWMKVFEDDASMRNLLIDAFVGTRASECFDANGQVVTPAPNPDGLPSGGRI